MVLLKRFYQISERSTHDISRKWKVLHCSLFILAAMSGFWTSYAFSKTLQNFNHYCILNANIIFTSSLPRKVPHLDINETATNGTTEMTMPLLINATNTTEGEDDKVGVLDHARPQDLSQTIDLAFTTWGTQSTCYFCQYTPVCSMIVAITWAAFFMVVSRGGGGYPSDIIGHPWRIVFPCIFFCTTFTIVLSSSVITMSNGFSRFCSQFELLTQRKRCSEAINDFTKQFSESKNDFYIFYNMASTTAYIGFFAWIAQLVLCLYRVLTVVDFKVDIVEVIEKEEEIVELVIEPTEFTDASSTKSIKN